MKNTTQIDKPVIGVYTDSTFGRIEIVGDIEYGPDDDYIYWRFNYGTPGKIHRTKIYYNGKDGNLYFRSPKGRIYFKDIQRV